MNSSGEPAPIIDASWIAENERDPKLRLIELDVSPSAYDGGHIPGAVFWNAYTDLRDADYRPIELDQLERLLSRSGVTPDATVVFYGYGAALGFWLMKAHGHNDVRMLLGSREQWAQSGGRWSTDVPAPAGSSYRLAGPGAEMLASAADVAAALSQPAVCCSTCAPSPSSAASAFGHRGPLRTPGAPDTSLERSACRSISSATRTIRSSPWTICGARWIGQASDPSRR